MDEKYDLFSPAFKADPFSTFACMREADPVYAHRTPDGRTIWYFTRYDDVTAVLKDNDHFCKDVRHARQDAAQSAAPQTSVHQAINRNMLFADPPDHTRLRALVSQAFTPRRVENMRDRIAAIAHELLDAAAAQRKPGLPGRFDLIADYALPLPVIVISEMLGIPAHDQEQVAAWSQSIISPGSRGLSRRARRRQLRAFVAYLRDLFAQRQQQPQDDLITALVQAEEAGDRLTEAELSSMVALLLVTGHETTVNLIGNGALALLQHPAQLARLRAGEADWGTAVAELLRYDGPVETSTTRWVRRDVTVRGQRLRRGDVVRVSLAAANRDGRIFPDPDVLDIDRADNRHLAFGLGIHYCLGAPLARLEGEIGLPSLFDRFPDLALAERPSALRWRPGVLFRGLEALPLCWLKSKSESKS